MSDAVTEAPKQQFFRDARRVSADLTHRARIQSALGKYYVKRDEKKGTYLNWAEARQAAAEIKWEGVNHLDHYLEEFEQKITARGVKVFWAPDGEAAKQYIVDLAKARGVRSVIKSKSMTSEEIRLNSAMEKIGCEVIESDLGEFIQQLRKEPPYHFVFPSMHLSRQEVNQTFQKELGSPSVETPEELTMIARGVMREKYCRAEMGITGANFAIAETGMISITENEGNARLTAGLPRIHVAVMGIEKVLPRFEDLALFLPLLATAGAGQTLTGYNTLYAGPKTADEPDGPEEFHVVLLDNHRTRLLADPQQRDALHCIRCGACLNVCPIFKNIGGFSYGTTYQGPIGSVITPHFKGLQDWKHLSGASSLCGACTEACPVKIDIHHHLLHNRRNAAEARPVWWEKLLFQGFVVAMNSIWIYRLNAKLTPFLLVLHRLIKASVLDPVLSWTKTRELPKTPEGTFKDYWAKRKRGV